MVQNGNSMKKVFLLFSSLILCVLIYSFLLEETTDFCVHNNCIRVKKSWGDGCKIFPLNPFSLTESTECYIKTTNTNNITFYYTNKKKKLLVYKSESPLVVVNKDTSFCVIKSFDSIYKAEFYPKESRKLKDVYEYVDLIDLRIKENFATDKSGEKIK